MQVRAFQLENFRCHASWQGRVTPGPGVIGVVGPNGSGKTSLLEALALLAPGRGLLGQEAAAHIRTGARHWAVHLELADGRTLGLRYQQGGRGGQRTVLLEGRAATQASLAGLGAVVTLTPQSDYLFRGPPEDRRRWLDDATSAWQPAHAEAVARYRQHRQARLKILARGQVGGDWLAAEERLCAEWGVAVLRGRVAYLAAWHAQATELELTLTGQAARLLDEPDPVAALQGKLTRSRAIDAQLNRTHAGPNTLDLGGTLRLAAPPGPRAIPLAQASAGQHKRALVTWLAGQARLLQASRHQPPLVLIDEFTAHLDAAARAHLLATLLGLGCQIWLADLDLPDLPGLQRLTLA